VIDGESKEAIWISPNNINKEELTKSQFIRIQDVLAMSR